MQWAEKLFQFWLNPALLKLSLFSGADRKFCKPIFGGGNHFFYRPVLPEKQADQTGFPQSTQTNFLEQGKFMCWMANLNTRSRSKKENVKLALTTQQKR